MLIAALIYSASAFIKTIRTVLTAVLAAITTLQQILFREDNVALLGVVKVLGVKFRSPEIVVHLVHVCKVNNKQCQGFKNHLF